MRTTSTIYALAAASSFVILGLIDGKSNGLLAKPKEIPLISQAANNQAADEQYARKFRDNVYKGCLANATKAYKNPKAYCGCYSSSYLTRYSPQELRAIDRAGGAGKQSVQTIVLMMSPEIKACAKSSQ